ncbi:alpha-2-macroglobulin family protein [Nannocystaceae bacterium ST9]
MKVLRPRLSRALVLLACMTTAIACKPRAGLGEGPPKIDERTKVLAAFEPAKLADPGASGLDLGALATDDAPSPPTPAELPPPAMIEFGPIGDTGEYASIDIRFNRPVAPLGDHERLDPKQLGLQIDPPIAGELYFVEPTRLVFSPTDALPPAQEYRVTLDAKLQAVDGPVFDAKASWAFATTPPSVSLWMDDAGRMQGEGETYHWKASMRLDAGGEVELAQLRKHLRAEAIDGDGKVTPIAFELRKAKKDRWGYANGEFELRPKASWPAGSEVVVRVDETLVGRSGPRPIGHEEALSFRVSEGVSVTDVGCYQATHADGCDLGPIRVTFSAPITRAQAERILVSPSTRGFDTLAIDRAYDENGHERSNAYWSVLAWGDFAFGGRYEVTIDPSLRDMYGQAFAGREEFEIGFVEPPPSLALASSQGTLVQAKSARVGVESRHAETLRLRVAVLDDATHERMLAHSLSDVGWPSKGAVLHDETITPIHQGAFAWAATEVDLGKFTGSRPGAVLFEASIDSLLPRAANRDMPPPQRGLVQITDLGVSVVGSLPGSWVRVANLATDKPIVGAEIELIDGPGGSRRVLGKTDTDGLLALPGAAELPSGALLRARKGDDHVLVAISSLHRGESHSEALKVGESVRVALTSERRLYKPGEVVRAIGWASVASPYEFSGLRPLPAKTMVQLDLRDFRGEVVATRTVAAKPHGKFWATLAVPAKAGLGDYTITATLLGQSTTAEVEVKDFVAPEFEVTAEAATTDLHHGETTTVSVNGRYYFGGPVVITRARETMACSEADFRPPGLEPAWTSAPRREWWGRGSSGLPVHVRLPATAERGHLETRFDPQGLDRQRTARCTYSIALADATEREVGAETSAWVHPPFYVAAAIPGFLVAQQELVVPVATLDFDGKPLPVGKLEVAVVRHWSEPEWVTENGEKVFAGWRERSKPLPTCRTDTKLGNASCSFGKIEHGSYTVTVRAEQGDYHPKLEGWLWAPEPDSAWTWSSAPAQQLTVEVDKPNPKPGELVHARVRAPWSSGKGMLLLSKGGIHELRRFNLEQGSAEFEFTTSDAWIPHAELWAMMIQPGSTTTHPRLATASASVDIGNQTRNLEVTLDVPSEARTGEQLPIVVHARDSLDQPVRGHVSVWAVDEAILALAPHTLPDFVGAFTVSFAGGLGFADGYGALIFPYVAHADFYSKLDFVMGWAKKPDEVLGTWGSMMGYGSGYGAGGGGYGVGTVGIGGQPMPARSKFSSAPIFIGDAELDEQGVAKLSGELPDNLTTFRVSAVVSSPLPEGKVEARFGTSDARVRVTRPVIVRAALPRIMRPGDTAEVGVLVDNLRAGAGEVEISVALHEAEGTLELLSPATATLAIAAGEQVRVPFQVRASKSGTPSFEARATVRPKQGKPEADAIRLPLPIEPERTLTDRVAVYGTLDDDGAALLPFELPDEIDPAFGGLSVSIGSSMLGGLEDAVAYLVEYPHGCLEQTSSSLLPLIPLGTLAGTYPLGITDTDAYVEVGIERLRTMQLPNGGFAYWPGGSEANRYGSAYATWVLGRANRAGYDVPVAMYDAALGYLAVEIDEWLTATAPTRGRDIEIALALAALAEIRAAPTAAIDKLHARRQGMPSFSKAMLLLAMHQQLPGDPRVKELLGELRSFIDEREAIARVEDGNSGLWTWYWDSSVRSSALALMAMLAVDPEHPLVPKLARGLLDSRRGGRWSNTQENAYALVALADYAAVYEADTPRFEGRVWLDRTAVARVKVEGRSFEFTEGFTGMTALLAADQQDPDSSRLLLERAGVGRMYYRVGLEWASTASDLPARSEGLTIAHAIRSMSGEIAEGQPIPTGELLALDVDLDTRSELTHVAIELPLPAGLEAIDLGLGKGTAAMKISGQRGWWVSHQELRRDRAVVFADHVAPGTHRTTVFLRATTPGEYVMPPATAEMMYYPEVYGRTASRRVSVR